MHSEDANADHASFFSKRYLLAMITFLFGSVIRFSHADLVRFASIFYVGAPNLVVTG